MTPGWLLGIFAAIMLLVSALSAARLATARPWHTAAVRDSTDIDVAHLLMGIAMAGMLTASLATLPSGAWIAVFAVLTAWFAWRVTADVRAEGARAFAAGHHTPHLMHSAAMTYMFCALTPASASAAGGMSGMSGGSGSAGTLAQPTLALVFALILAGYAVWDIDQITPPSGHRPLAWTGLGAAAAGAPAVAAAGNIPATAIPAAHDRIPETASAFAAGTATAKLPPGPGMPSGPTALGRVSGEILAPQVAVGCRIAMGVTMAFMLIIMI